MKRPAVEHPPAAPEHLRTGPSDHPIAPTEFPKARSATEPFGPEGHHGLRHARLRRRIPSAGHALERLPAWAYPRVS